MHLTEILTPERIKPALVGSSKQAVIAELLDLLAQTGDVTDSPKVMQAVLDRENTRTTGIGHGVAVPHGKSAGVNGLAMAIGKAPGGIDFQSIDGKPVTLVFLLVSPPDRTGPHIQALAHISRLLSIDAFRNKLSAAATAQEIFDLIKAQEEHEK